MYKSIPALKKTLLDTSLHQLHKQGREKSDFGMDDSPELLDGGFGLYSTRDLKERIPPIKTEYFRIGLTRHGQAQFNIGLETYNPVRNNILFSFPGQVFSLEHRSDDFLAYYMLFSEAFIPDIFQPRKQQSYPFLEYTGLQCFPLDEESADEVESLIFKMNTELKARKANCSEAIRLHIRLILLHANRNYTTLLVSHREPAGSGQELFRNYVRLVSLHFLAVRKVSDYAAMLHVSPDHLNRVIKAHSDKTANGLIDEMLLLEAKTYLLHSQLSVAEIAYTLGFTDPSHFNKFFKKGSGITPLRFRH